MRKKSYKFILLSTLIAGLAAGVPANANAFEECYAMGRKMELKCEMNYGLQCMENCFLTNLTYARQCINQCQWDYIHCMDQVPSAVENCHYKILDDSANSPGPFFDGWAGD